MNHSGEYHPRTQRAAARRLARRRRHRRSIIACVAVAALAAVLVLAVRPLLRPAAAASDAAGSQSRPASEAQQNASSSAAASAAPSAGAASPAASAASPAAPTSAPTPSTDPNFVCTWDTTGEEGYDYLLAVNRVGNCVTVFTKDADGNYTVPYFAMVASSGAATPVGSYHTIVNYRWRLLEGNVYGQYATRITGSILFHSVPYFSQSTSDLEYDEFNKLGTAASLGCIRLQVKDAKWIYDNCPIGTPTILYDDANCAGPLGRPDFTHIDTSIETLRGWDPTDPSTDNPWAAQ